MFIVENSLIQKENIINSNKKRIAKLTEYHKDEFVKETFVIEPTSSVNAIHDELLLYKQIYESLSKHIISMKTSIEHYEINIKVIIIVLLYLT